MVERISLLVFCLVACDIDVKECPPGSEIVDEICMVMPNEYLELPVDHVKMAVSVLQEEINAYYPDVTDIRSLFGEIGLVVRFTQDHISMDCVEKDSHWECKMVKIGGVAYEPGQYAVVYWEQCLGESSFVHELMHVVEWQWFGNSPKDHSRKYFYSIRHNVDSIEFKVRQRLVHLIGDPCLI